MTSNDISGIDAVNAIKRPGAEPSGEPDERTFQELVDLSPARRAAYFEGLFVDEVKRRNRHLEAEARRTEAELVRLRTIERTHDKLLYARAWQLFLNPVSAVAGVVGSGLISSYPKDANSIWFGVGWGLVGMAAILILGQAVVRSTVVVSLRRVAPSSPK